MTQTTYFNAQLFDGLHDGFTANSWFTVDDESGKLTATGTGDAPASDQ